MNAQADTTASLKHYSLKEVAELMKVSERTLHNYIKFGRLKAVKFGGRWKVAESTLEQIAHGKG